MKPLKLVIQGIRSFSDRVEIDFETVSKNGLFGIFGSTGSGKSTILDSVIIALYGEISGHKMLELISARCKSAYVSLSFELCHKDSRKSYLVERTFKLKKDGTYGGAIASLYETTSGSTVVLASQTNDVNKMIEEILGLGQNEFTKCIILPQGEFSEFVKATKSDRVRIIEKLFSLERYGERFNEKLKAKLGELDFQIKLKEENLKQFESDTKDALDLASKEEENTKILLDIENEKLVKITDYIDKNQYYYNLNKQLDLDRENFENLTQKLAEIEELKAGLSLYDKANEICEQEEKFQKYVAEFEDCNNRFLLLEKEYMTANTNYENCKNEYEKLELLVSQRKEEEDKKERLLNAQVDFARYFELQSQIKNCTANFDTLSKNFQKNAVTLQNYANLEQDLTCKVKEIENVIKISDVFETIGDVALKEEYKNQIEYYVNQQVKLNTYSNLSDLYEYVSSEYSNRLKYYEDKISVIKTVGEESIENAIEKYKQSMKIKRQLEEEYRSCSVNKARLEQEQENIRNAQLVAEQQLDILKKESDTLNVKLLKIVDNIESFENNLIFVSDKIKSLVSKENKVINDYLISKETLSKVQLDFTAVEIKLSEVKKKKEEQFSVVSNLLTSSISSVDYAVKICEEIGDVDKMKQRIEEYVKDYDFYNKSIQRMQNELNSVGFDNVYYSKTMQERALIASNCENLKENLIKCQNNTKKLSRNFDKRCIIEKELSILRAREGVYKRLDQAVARKAFSEFISAEFLSDVARMARRTLLELTSGKYDVVYKDSLDGAKDGFYIVDNLNGGLERPVSSLSGGETFLVSLSLALALSAGIYADSDRPMEFFFLDEGFGTLDENLIEIVLDSLEKLRNKNFSIGLISHLAEMKSRIDSKITVIPADEIHGSRVVINA
ncbi:MAG: SMC family ATPase [Clostridia bacterium]|nr:SMC family ATPase [Clostridia bacterium]